MANTPNYNLKKVEYTEIADIPGHFNANFDKIDTVMKNNADAAVAAEDNAKSYASGLIGTLSNLLTTAKNNIVVAVNEIFGKVEDVEDSLATHLAETIHQGKHSTLEATSTDDATSATNAPLKSAGGLAVAKKAYIGGGIDVRSSDKGLALSIGQGSTTGYQKWIFDRDGLGELLNTNQRVRIRYELNGNRRTVYLRVLVVSFRASSTSNHKRMIEKLITFDLNDSQNINNYADNVLLKSNVDDNDLYVVSVGSDNQFDLIYNGHPDTYQDNWAIVIESLHGRFPLIPIEAVVEDIE